MSDAHEMRRWPGKVAATATGLELGHHGEELPVDKTVIDCLPVATRILLPKLPAACVYCCPSFLSAGWRCCPYQGKEEGRARPLSLALPPTAAIPAAQSQIQHLHRIAPQSHLYAQ